MSYGEFLLQWYNLLFLGLGVAGAGLALWGRSRQRGRDRFTLTAAVLATALAGLTLNGAVHDLRMGDPGAHFWWVLPAAMALGGAAGAGIRWARDRWFPPISGVRFNPPGQEGTEARVVSSSVEEEPGSGRAQWQDDDGVLTVVHCHTGEGEMMFGARVRLEAFDEDEESYLVAYSSE